MAKYLSENEVGYDQTELGFPSITGCHAIVYMTTDRLFGLHNYGGDARVHWMERSAALASFVSSHAGGAGRLLYGVCYATGGNPRGYGGNAPKNVWTEELAAFAEALGYGGEIWGYDLADSGIASPAYVLYHRPAGTTCVIQVKAWNQAHSVRGQNPSPNDHKMMRRNEDGVGYRLQAQPNVVTSVTTAGLRTVYPEKLRG
ncbi:MAG TPA: hypothetical protein VGM07_11215 [Stellaceae bacterium]|jgi:hypothetical protein